MRRVVPILVGLALAAFAFADEPGVAKAPPDATLDVGPIAYFNANCASCHGDYGSFWGDGFASLPADELRAVVDEMAHGPAFAPIEGVALEAQVAYNRSLSDAGRLDGPFVIAVRRGGRLVGEVTPGATVSVEGVAATVDGHEWSSDVAGPKEVVAELDGRTTRLPLGVGGVIWSHAAAPATRPAGE